MTLKHTPSKIVPTVGRNIHVYPELRRRTAKPWHANVADVHFTDGDTNLVYPLITTGGFTNAGQPVAFERIPVLDLAPDEPWPDFAFATWMPFQKGQASKTDELTPRVNAITELLNHLLQGNPARACDFEALGLPVPDFLKPWASDQPPPPYEVDVDATLGQCIGSDIPTAPGTCAGSLGGAAAGPDAASADDGAAPTLPCSEPASPFTPDVDQDRPGT